MYTYDLFLYEWYPSMKTYLQKVNNLTGVHEAKPTEG